MYVDFARCWANDGWRQCSNVVPDPTVDPEHVGLCDVHYERLLEGAL